MKHFLTIALLLSAICAFAQNSIPHIVHVKVQEDIAPSATRILSKALDTANAQNADLLLLELDTYGGALIDADSMRIAILNAQMPVVAFINKNAASAGALISIACDRIYMSSGATIGSATVVNGEGEVLPDKYQSYMRSIMRSTAESHGADTTIENGETVIRYKRDPKIAEAMVDDRIAIPGIIDSGRIVAFTTAEAIEHGYCEGKAESIQDVLHFENIEGAQITLVEKSSLDKVIGYLANPALQGMLLMFIFWGIFFEIRSPGIGFPLAIAVLAALLYFAPLYLDGLAANWEILLFIIGLALIGLEIFVIPGFGVAGILGILLTVGSLILSLVRNVNFDFSLTSEVELGNALLLVLIALIGFIVGAFIFGKGMMNTPLFRRLVQENTLSEARAGIHMPSNTNDSFIGTKGFAHTDIRPMGKAKFNDSIIDVKSLGAFISKGSAVIVIAKELGYWVVEEDKS